MTTAINNSDIKMSICIPRAFENISEARVRSVFEKLGIFTIDRVDVVLRKNEKGDTYKRFFVHIKDWEQTSDAQKAKERLIAGKELKIVYDEPWFWKVGLNTWTPKPQPQQPLLNDRKPRIRLEFEEDQDTKNANAASALLSNLSLKETDRRPYSQRRMDPAYCEQDVQQGFRDRRYDDRRDRSRSPVRRDDRRYDRRERSRSPVRRDDRRYDDRRYDDRRYRSRSPVRKDDQKGNRRRESRFTDRSPPRTLLKDERPVVNTSKPQKPVEQVKPVVVAPVEQVKPVVVAPVEQVKPVVVAPVEQVKAVVVAPVVEVKKSTFVMNPDVRLMVATYLGIGRDEVTEDQYKNNSQFVRDLRQDDMDKQKDEDAQNGVKPLDYSTLPAEAPKRKGRKIAESKK
jgi:hypothetical protein